MVKDKQCLPAPVIGIKNGLVGTVSGTIKKPRRATTAVVRLHGKQFNKTFTSRSL